MYEIWLVLNILWEIALGVAPLLVGLLAAWVLLMAVAWRCGAPWRRALPTALTAGGVVAVLAFLSLPTLTQSSLSEMGYWVDWANLVAMALAAGVAAAVFVWPLAGWRLARRSGSVYPNAPDSKTRMVRMGGAS